MARQLLAGSSDEESTIDTVLSWEGTVLFLSFVLVTLAWEFGTALLAYLTVRLSGRKAIWLQRIKGEVLALGIITLILTVATSSLERICIPDSTPQWRRRQLLAAGSGYECPSGSRQLFPPTLIHETHMLLFTAAIVHIVASCTSFYLTIARMRLWRKWEKNARTAYELQLEEEEILTQLGGSWVTHALISVRNAFTSAVNEPLYNLLRLLFKFRIDDAVKASAHPHDQLPANFSFLNVVEQAMEVAFSQGTAGLTIVLFIFMAIFLVIPRIAHGIYFLSLMSIITTLIVSAKYQSVAVQLASCTLFDFTKRIKEIQVSKKKSVERIATVKASSKFFDGFSSGLVNFSLLRTPRASGPAAARHSHSNASAVGESLEDGGGPPRPFGSGVFGPEPVRTSSAIIAEPNGRSSPVLPPSPSGSADPTALNTPGSVTGPSPATRSAMRVSIELPAADKGSAASTGPPALTTFMGSHSRVAPEPPAARSSARTSGPGTDGGLAATQTMPAGREKSLTSKLGELGEYRSRVQFHFLDPNDPGPNPPLRSNCYDLFWFKSPRFLYFLYELAWCETSIALTLLFFGLAQDGSKFSQHDGVWLVTLAIVANILVLCYSALCVHPVAALVMTVGTSSPARLVREIKKSKLVEEEDYEEGIGGAFIRWCFGGGQEDEELLLGKSMPFIMALADQAGVIASAKQHGLTAEEARKNENIRVLYRKFAEMWVLKAEEHRHPTPDRAPGDGEVYLIEFDLSDVYEGFCLIDRNNSGTISSAELAAVLKAMGTRATAEELQDMVDEIDLNGTDSIDFTEFCLFLVFKFFDEDKDGFIGREDCEKTLAGLEMECGHGKAEQMIDMCMDLRYKRKDPRRLVHLSDFIRIFTTIADLVHVDPPPQISQTTPQQQQQQQQQQQGDTPPNAQ